MNGVVKRTTFWRGGVKLTEKVYWGFWYLTEIDWILNRNPQRFSLRVTYHG